MINIHGETMPIDQRRINGPEISIPYNIYKLDDETQKIDKTKRRDGRHNTELRKMCKFVIVLF